MRLPCIQVAVSVVRASDGRVLLAERTARQLSAGQWELPGGKIDPGETAMQAAARELDEEVGIQAQVLQPWLIHEHAFKTQRVRLHFFLVTDWRGQAHGREGQRLAWVDPAVPTELPLLASNRRAWLALGLPAEIVQIGAAQTGGLEACMALLSQALAAGAGLLQLDAPPLAADQRVAYARRAAALAQRHGARIIFSGSALEARRAGVTGLHSSAPELWRLSARPPLALWSVSCQDTADLARASALAADLVLLAPVQGAGGNSSLASMGCERVRQLAASVPLPLFVQGDPGCDTLQDARQAGAHGLIVSANDWLARRVARATA